MGKHDWIKDKIGTLDDEALFEVAEVVTDKLAGKEEEKFNDDIVHITELEDEIAEIRSERGKFKGFHTGYSTLDEKMGGLEKGSVILIGGETSNGKSALSANMAIKVAQEVPVLYISLEMTRKQMLDRIDHMTDGKTDIDLMFQQSFDLGYKDLEPLLKKAREMGDIKVVFLDYLQYLGRGMDDREIAKMSKTIKKLALKYEIAFVVIVSLRKAGADVKNKRKWYDIETEDLMGTAAIGYDADTVIIASRKNEENEFDAEHIYVKVLKTRNVALNFNDRIVQLKWDRTKITEDWTVPYNPFRETK